MGPRRWSLRRGSSWTTRGWLAGLLLAAPSARAADTKRACIEAAEEGQRLRVDMHLVDARAPLSACARDVCPAVIREDCRKWLAEVEASVPTVVVVAKDAAGADLFDVAVEIDGSPAAERLDGLPLPVDAGEHRFVFRRASGATERALVVVRTGEKNRPVPVRFEAPTAVTAAPSAPTEPAPPTTSVPPVAWALFGTGAAALGVGLVLGISGYEDAKELESTCGTSCDPSTVDPVRTRLIVGDVLMVAGVVAAGAGVWLTLAAPKAVAFPKVDGPKGPRFGVAPTAGGARGELSVRF